MPLNTTQRKYCLKQLYCSYRSFFLRCFKLTLSAYINASTGCSTYEYEGNNNLWPQIGFTDEKYRV